MLYHLPLYVLFINNKQKLIVIETKNNFASNTEIFVFVHQTQYDTKDLKQYFLVDYVTF